jgi:hypothetical protein
MKDEARTQTLRYTPRPGVTAAQELDALAEAYRFILSCCAEKKGGPETAPDDAKEIKNVRAAEKYTR